MTPIQICMIETCSVNFYSAFRKRQASHSTISVLGILHGVCWSPKSHRNFLHKQDSYNYKLLLCKGFVHPESFCFFFVFFWRGDLHFDYCIQSSFLIHFVHVPCTTTSNTHACYERVSYHTMAMANLTQCFDMSTYIANKHHHDVNIPTHAC